MLGGCAALGERKTCFPWDSICAGICGSSCASPRVLCLLLFWRLEALNLKAFYWGLDPRCKVMHIQVSPHLFHLEDSPLFSPGQFLITILKDIRPLNLKRGLFLCPWAFLPHYLPLLSVLEDPLLTTTAPPPIPKIPKIWGMLTGDGGDGQKRIPRRTWEMLRVLLVVIPRHKLWVD